MRFVDPASESSYRPGAFVRVRDRMSPWPCRPYRLDAPVGDFSDWRALVGAVPNMTPRGMLEKGVFEGKYMNDQRAEFPKSWFADARIVGSGGSPDITKNCFGVKSRLPLSVWKQKHWIIAPDPRGWFQWYCRYYLGRRIPDVDRVQIRRWKSFVSRHLAQVVKHCCDKSGRIIPGCRPRQRQGLLQWAFWSDCSGATPLGK